MRDLIALIDEYATARGAAERHHALLECLIDDNDGFFAAKIAEYEGAATTCHAQLMTAYDQLTRTTVHAVADERLPVCTWQKGVVEVRGVLPDATRSVRVRYTPAQAIAAGAALIACAALADGDTGGTLHPDPSRLPRHRPRPTGDRDRHDHQGHQVMGDNPDLTARPDDLSEGQYTLGAPHRLTVLT